MNKEKKLELLVKHDFSGFRSEFNKRGFGQNLNWVLAISDVMKNKEIFERMFLFREIEEAYSNLIEPYLSIDFNELDRSDSDFRFLFDYSDKLIELGTEINNLKNNILDKKNNLSFDKIDNIIYKDLKNMNYRRDVLRKYGLEYSGVNGSD